MRTRPSSPAKMNRLKNKLRGKRDVASQDGTAPGTVAQLTDGLSASTLTDPNGPTDLKDPDGLGLKVWSEPSVDHGPLVDIVFVHGLTGKRTKTWLADGAALPWPQELLSKKIPEARLLTYGYNADVVYFIKPAGQNTVREHARNLTGDLTDLRLRTSSFQRPLIFVAHSLGGLVCEEAFILSFHAFEAEHQLSDSLHGIVFLGTPHAGSDLSKIALALDYFIKFSLVKSPNTSNIAVLEKDSEVLAGIQDSFSTAITKRDKLEKKSLAIHCCIEENPVQWLGRRVVEPASAHFPGYHTSSTIPADHMGMTKFQHSSQVGYERLSDRLKRWVDVIRGNMVLAQPDAVVVMPFAQDRDFVGREDILTSLDEGFSQPTSLRRMALAGLGGIGKSQIAIEYAYRLRKKWPTRSVFWVHANNTARFEQSYRSIATAARIPGIEDPKSNVLNLVFQWLLSDESGAWLLILDNADDADIFFGPLAAPAIQSDAGLESPCLSQFLPQTGTGSILITSRDEGTAIRLTGGPKQVLRVDIMSEADTLALLTKRLPEDQSDESTRKGLITELDSVPLAITQASAYITVQGSRMTIAKYLSFLQRDEKNQIHLLSKDEADLRRDPAVPNSVIRTWQISFSQIKEQNPSATDLLSCMCMLDRQGLPEFLFCEDADQSLDFEEAIGTLIRFSFVTEEKEQKVFSIHRLVQLATRKWIETYGEIGRVQEEALRLVSKKYPSGRFENRTTCEAMDPHAQIVLNYICDSEACKLQQATILYNRAWYAQTQGRFKVAEEGLQRAVDIQRACLDSDKTTLYCLQLLASTYQDQGRWTEAEELNLQVLETSKKLLGAEHSNTLIIMNNLAMTYWNQGRLTEAEELNVQVLKIKEKVLGPEHSETLTIMNNLAVTYENQNRLVEAEELGVQVLDIRRRVLGPEHPDTLTIMSNLAMTYRDQRRLAEAEELGVQVLNTEKRVLGPDHPDTLISMDNLAHTYHDQDRHSEAIGLMEKVVELRKRILGANHPDTIGSIDFMAEWTDTLGRI
ncbi:MAG: hypothetical protein ASARMPREDX12_007021 [Alectoria sarmentosa]|nr:MAG: hypothetical protein ASARMPREDX12_007021 [Alectoria sarmentosa]